MRFTPQIRALEWLVRQPFAHRGLHDQANGAVENCETAFAAAISHGFAIECDVQLTADGEAVVFHDDCVDRLLDAKGTVKTLTTQTLKAAAFKHGNDRVQTLAELLEQVDGACPLLIEIKSLWDDDDTLADRTVAALAAYKGPCAIMSFDPDKVARVAAIAPALTRGITADRVIDSSYDPLPISQRIALREMSHLPESQPHFISFDFHQLPFLPVTELRAFGIPVLTWTIRSAAEAQQARRWSDQITFETFIPA